MKKNIREELAGDGKLSLFTGVDGDCVVTPQEEVVTRIDTCCIVTRQIGDTEVNKDCVATLRSGNRRVDRDCVEVVECVE